MHFEYEFEFEYHFIEYEYEYEYDGKPNCATSRRASRDHVSSSMNPNAASARGSIPF
jgi:hypothetical protein